MENINNNIENKVGAVLLTYRVSSGWAPGSSSNYVITDDGKIRLTLTYGYVSPNGPTSVTIEDNLTPEELKAVYDFIRSEVAGKEYESSQMTDVSFTLNANGRNFHNCMELNDKFMELLNAIAARHRVFSNDSIDPLFSQMALQHEETAMEKMGLSDMEGYATKGEGPDINHNQGIVEGQPPITNVNVPRANNDEIDHMLSDIPKDTSANNQYVNK